MASFIRRSFINARAAPPPLAAAPLLADSLLAAAAGALSMLRCGARRRAALCIHRRRHVYLEDRNGFALSLDRHTAKGAKIVRAGQTTARGVADDNPRFVILVQRLQPRAEVHIIADDGVAHDRRGPDVPRDHVSRI